MDPWHTAHLLSLGLWGGLVAAEGVVELTPRTDDELRFAATLHYWMDVLLELPLLAAVLVTGAVLTAAAWPLSPLHGVKIAAGLTAVGANLWCVAHVIARRRGLGDIEQVQAGAAGGGGGDTAGGGGAGAGVRVLRAVTTASLPARHSEWSRARST
jgi:hypothetical protein